MTRMNNHNLLLVAGVVVFIIVIVAIAGCLVFNNNSTSSPASTPIQYVTNTQPTAMATPMPSPVPNGTIVRLGITARESTIPEDIYPDYTPLINYLDNVTGYDWQIFCGTDDTSIITAMQNKQIDVGFYSPLYYPVAADSTGAQAFVASTDQAGDLCAHSAVYCTPAVAKAIGFNGTPFRGEAGLASLKKMLDAHQGQYTMAYVDPESVSGYGFFRGTAALVNLDPSVEFKKTTFLGGYPLILQLVASGASDLGVCSDSQITSSIASGQVEPGQTVELWVSDPIPNSPVAYRNDLPNDEEVKIQNAFINAPSSILLNTTGANQYKAVNDSVYAPIHDVAIAFCKQYWEENQEGRSIVINNSSVQIFGRVCGSLSGDSEGHKLF